MYKSISFFAALICVLCFAAQVAAAREITDMDGNKVDVPEKIDRVYGAGPPDQWLLYAIDPKLIAARTSAFRQQGLRYLDQAFQNLPLVTGFIRGSSVNVEAVTGLKPDIVLLWNETTGNENFRHTLTAAHVPVLFTRHRTYDDIVAGLLFVGALTGREARAQSLADYATESRQGIAGMVATLAANEKLKLYLAESDDGLSSRCDNSTHGEVLRLAGAHVVPECKASSAYVSAELSMEELIGYDPDVIITISPIFLRESRTNTKWRLLKAVRDGRVYLIPSAPFNWITRPPSFMRILGAKWIASLLYPTRYNVDMVKETEAFYRLFLGVEISGDDTRDILQGK